MISSVVWWSVKFIIFRTFWNQHDDLLPIPALADVSQPPHHHHHAGRYPRSFPCLKASRRLGLCVLCECLSVRVPLPCQLLQSELQGNDWCDQSERITISTGSWCSSRNSKYRNDPKFSDRYAWANSVDPDQTAPRGGVWSGSTLFAIPSASFGTITLC